MFTFLLMFIIFSCASSEWISDAVDVIEAPEGITLDLAEKYGHFNQRVLKLPVVSDSKEYHDLERLKNVSIAAHSGRHHLEIFCYSGDHKRLFTFFRTAEMLLLIRSEASFRYYEGNNASEVRRLYADSSWFSLSPWRTTSFKLDLYNQSCVGVDSPEAYKVQLRIRFVDVWRVLCLCCGVLLFSTARSLARNLLFHYMSASLLGVLGASLLLLFLVAKLLPKKSAAASIFIGGSGLLLYLFQLFYSNFVYIVNEYYTVCLGYVTVAAVVSFAAVYRSGGISDPRSLQLLQWLLQGCGLTAVYCSSQHKEAVLAVLLILIAYYNAPSFLKTAVKTAWRKRFPPRVKLLTEEQYIEQGAKETKAALEQLRTYCRSPDCNAWRTLSRLRSPHRFVEFVEGSHHITDEEVLEHSVYSPSTLEFTDEEDELTDDSAD